MDPISRRQFVGTGLAACACALCPAAKVAAAAAAGPVEVGVVGDFGRAGAYDRWAESGFFLVRRGSRLYALSSTCTHKDVRIVSKHNALRCPKHGSIFSLEGDVKKAPAKKPLDRFGISVDGSGRVVVDPSKRFSGKRRGEPGSFVEVPG